MEEDLHLCARLATISSDAAIYKVLNNFLEADSLFLKSYAKSVLTKSTGESNQERQIVLVVS